MELQFGGYSFSVDLAGMNGDKATEKNTTKQAGQGPLNITVESEGYIVSFDLENLLKAESFDEFEKTLKCYQYEEVASSQLEGSDSISTETAD